MSSSRRAAVVVGAIVAIVLMVALVNACRETLAERDATAVAALGVAHVNQILGPREFNAFGGEIGPDFGVTSGPAIVLSAGGALRVVDLISASRLRTADVDVTGTQPDSLALDASGTMLAVADGYFGVLNPEGEITKSVPVPYNGARLAPSVHEGAAYLFGGTKKDYRLYRFIDDGTLQILLDSEEPIIAAADNEGAMYAATGSQIMRITAGTPEILFTAPQDEFAGPIRSLAVTEDGVVIFSTDTKVYSLLGPNALSIINDAGGSLRLRDGVLYVLDPRRKILFSLAPASSKLFNEAAQ